MAIRVHELAKELNISSNSLKERLKSIGIEKNNNFSGLTDEEVLAVRRSLGMDGGKKTENAGKPGQAEKALKADKAEKSERPEKPERPERPEKAGKADKNKKTERPEKLRQIEGKEKNENIAKDNTVKAERSEKSEKKYDRPASDNRKQETRDQEGRKSSWKERKDRQNKNRQQDRSNQQQNANKNGTSQYDPQRQQKSSGWKQKDQQNNRNGRDAGKPSAALSGNDQRRRQDGDRRQDRRNDRRNDRNDRNNRSDRNERAERGDKRNDQRKDRKNADKNSRLQNMAKISKPQHSKSKDLRKEQRKEAAKKAEEEAMAIPAGAVVVTVPITVKGFSEQLGVSLSEVIMPLMKMGIMANANQNLDEDTVQILADDLGKQIVIGKVEKEEAEDGIESFEDRDEDLSARPPIITVMGHVDHGKTSLLDRIRSTSVTESESGGITQHIGASEITHNGQRIVFLDTPGHEAFTAMRARGAYVTDIAVLVVAADDSVKPQTIEAISHAKAANVPVIVAINKMDKPGANPDKVKQDLSENGILVEEWGGDVICVPVSAKTGEGIDTLLEMILLQAEMLELKANPDRLALGTVIEARLDKQKGAVATLLVQNGTLHAGMSIVAGNCSGKIKAMTNFKGDALKKAGPATAVEILGLTEVPEAGDSFNAVSSDKLAREIAEKRKQKQREQVLQKTAGVTLEDLFSQIEQNSLKELNIIVKADVQGSVGALVTSLEKIKNEEVAVKIVHTGVGAINESDVMLAGTTGAIIIGLNVRPSNAVASKAQMDGVEIRTYRVIYEAIEDIEAALKGMLSPEFKEEVIGTAEVRNTFKVPGVGTVAGAYVTDGKMERNAGLRLVRDGIVVHEGRISSLKRFKDDAKEVAKGFECGLGIEDFNDIKEGDVLEAYKMVEVERK